MKHWILKGLMALVAATGVVSAEPAEAVEKEPVTLDVAATEKWLAEHPKAVVLDVRTKEEHAEGALKGAVLIPVTDEDFLERVKKAIQPEQEVLVYCRSGGRSARAVKVLQEAGYVNLKELGGGVTAWQKADKPLVK